MSQTQSLRFRLQSILTLGIIAAGSLAALTHSGPTNNGYLQLIRKAAATTNTANANRVHVTETVSVPGARTVTLTLDSLSSRSPREGWATISSSTGFTKRLVLVRGVMYSRVAPSQVAGNDNKQWVGVRAPHLIAEKQFEDASGGGYLQLLAGATGGVSRVGTATVAGVPTTEYHVTIGLDSVVVARAAQVVPGFAQALKAFGLHTLPVDVWLDSTGRPRQLDLKFTVQGATINALAQVTPVRGVSHVARPARRNTHLVGDLGTWARLSTGGQSAFGS